MSPVFVDSFYFFAILNQKDLAHPKLVMKQRGINDALTGDHHFEQAGFTALLK